MKKRKTLGSMVIALLCVCFVLGAYFLSEKDPSQSEIPGEIPQSGSQNEQEQDSDLSQKEESQTGSENVEEVETELIFDFSAPVTRIAEKNQITEVRVPAKEEELRYVPWDYYEGMEVAVKNYELSKKLLYDVPLDSIPSEFFLSNDQVSYDKSFEVNQDGSWKTAHTYVYLWARLRNTTEKAIECNFVELKLATLNQETNRYDNLSDLLYNQDAVMPPAGLSDIELFEWNPDRVRFEPGETKDCFLAYFVFDDIYGVPLEKTDIAIGLNFAGSGVRDDGVHFIRLIQE